MRARTFFSIVVASGALAGGVMYATDRDVVADRVSDEVTQSLRADGVDVRGAYCDYRGDCWVTLNDSSIIRIRVNLFEDGSWSFTERSRP